MTTPLQKAAQALMDAMTQTDFTCRLGEQLDACEKALDAEISQAVEPVAWGMRRPVTPLVLDIICPKEHARHEGEYTIPLYLHPPQPKQVTCQIYGHVVGACVECNTHIEAQQAKRGPMTGEQINEMAIQEQFLLVCDGIEELTQIVRATEQRHNITPANKPTDWSAA